MSWMVDLSGSKIEKVSIIELSPVTLVDEII